MAATFILATVLAAGAPAAADSVDVAYDALIQGQHEVAIEKLEGTSDAARLINLGAAYAAEGRVVDARAAYEKAAFAERYELETASGEWVDSRVLARQALASLDRPYLDTRMAKID